MCTRQREITYTCDTSGYVVDWEPRGYTLGGLAHYCLAQSENKSIKEELRHSIVDTVISYICLK